MIEITLIALEMHLFIIRVGVIFNVGVYIKKIEGKKLKLSK